MLDGPRGPFATLHAHLAESAPRHGAALLVPGWTGSKEDFTAVLRPLAAQGYEVLALDQRGQHETPGPDDAAAYALDALADDLLAVTGALDGPVHLLGHSFGGIVAQRAVIRDPAAFASLTLLCSGAGPVPQERHVLLRLMADAISAYGLAPTYAAKLAHDRSQPTYVDPGPEAVAFLERRFVANAPASLRAMTLHLVEAPDLVEDVAAIGVPALVAYGAQDDGWPTDGQEAMAERLHAELVRLDDAGHSPAVDDPEGLAAVLTAFWAQVVPPVSRT